MKESDAVATKTLAEPLIAGETTTTRAAQGLLAISREVSLDGLRAKDLMNEGRPSIPGTPARPRNETAWRRFDQTVAEIREKFADLPTGEVQAMIDEAITSVRSEMFPRSGPTLI